MIKWFDCSRWMQCDARSTANQGESEGVDLRPRLKMSPKICQEIAHNAPPQVIFFTKNETTPKNYNPVGISAKMVSIPKVSFTFFISALGPVVSLA